MEEILKNILFTISIISGSLMVISLLIIANIKLICVAIDHLKVGNVIKECLIIYLKQKRPDWKIKKEDISFEKGRINKK